MIETGIGDPVVTDDDFRCVESVGPGGSVDKYNASCRYSFIGIVLDNAALGAEDGTITADVFEAAATDKKIAARL